MLLKSSIVELDPVKPFCEVQGTSLWFNIEMTIDYSSCIFIYLFLYFHKSHSDCIYVLMSCSLCKNWNY